MLLCTCVRSPARPGFGFWKYPDEKQFIHRLHLKLLGDNGAGPDAVSGDGEGFEDHFARGQEDRLLVDVSRPLPASDRLERVRHRTVDGEEDVHILALASQLHSRLIVDLRAPVERGIANVGG